MTPYPKHPRLRLKGEAYRKLMRQAWERDKGLCQECGVYTEEIPHHVIFKSQGGSDVLENLTLLCYDCHYRKHN
jgi:5-methylcytosine-specific restriction endonuclease McrA